MKTLYILLLFLFARTATSQSWSPGGAFPGGTRDGAIAFSIGDKVYFGGGESKDFWEYDTKASTWTRKADIPGVTTDREFATAFSIGSMGYVGLGVDNGTLLADLWEYDPATNKWARKADYPAGGRDAILSFVIGDKAYVGGGTNNKFIYSEFFQFDPIANKWTLIGPLPMGAVAFASSFVIGAKAYVTGGDLGTGNGQLAEVYSFDQATNEWLMLSPFPGASRQTAVGFALNGKGFVGLGQANYDTVFSDFYSYDTASDVWTRVSGDFPIKPGRAWATAVTANGKAYIGGGWDFKDNFFKDWWRFDPTGTAGVRAASAKSQLVAYPNPASSNFRISGEAVSADHDVQVLDALGNHMSGVERLPAGGYDIAPLPIGEYFVKLSHGDSTQIFKLVKE